MLYPTHSSRSTQARNPRAGSALIISIIFSMIIMFGLAGLLPMLVSDWKMSAQTSTQEAAFTLAESGIDEAIWAVLEYADDDDQWTDNGWGDGGNYWHREWTLASLSSTLGNDFELDEGRTGIYRVIVQKVNASVINIVSQGLVSGGKNVRSGHDVARYIETEFRRPNPLGYGLIARDGLDFNGQPTFDSYHSSQGSNPGSGSGPSSKATVGSVSLNLSKLDVGNSHIFGDLATGASDNGTDPSGGATVSGDIVWDFKMDFPSVVKPDTTGWSTGI